MTRPDTHKTRLRGKAWCIDKEGYCHLAHQTKKGLTFCRRPSARMKKSWRGDLQVDCEACSDLLRISHEWES